MSTSDFRSFRLYRPRRVTVSRFVEDYSIEERLKIRESFRVYSKRYRIHLRMFVSFMLVCAITWLTAVLFPRVNWPEGLFFLAFLGAAVFLCSSPPLRCPGHRNDPPRLGPRCPEVRVSSISPVTGIPYTR